MTVILFQIVRCAGCGRDAHVEPGQCDQPALCVSCSIRDPRALSVPAALDRPTSVAAGAAVAPVAGELHRKVLRAVIDAGPTGLTDEELQQRLAMSGNTERPRRRWLEQNGYVRDSGGVRKTTSGRSAVVWISTGQKLENAA